MQALCEEVDQPAVGGDRVRIGFAFLDAGADHFYVGQLEDGFARTSLTALLTQVLHTHADAFMHRHDVRSHLRVWNQSARRSDTQYSWYDACLAGAVAHQRICL
jgi:hypothetical protein